MNQATDTARGAATTKRTFSPGRAWRLPVALLLVLGALLYVMWGWLARRRTVRIVSSQWAAYSRCILGDEPLGKDERPVTRMRRIEVSLPEPGTVPTANDTSNEWPDRCQGYLSTIHGALVDSGLDRDPRFAHFDRLVQTASQPHGSLVPQYLDDRVIVDELFEAARDAAVPEATASGDVRPAPAAARPLEIWKVEPLASVAGDLLPRSDPVPSAMLHVLWPNELGISYACSFSPSGGEVMASVRCTGLGIARRWTSLASFATMDDDFKGLVIADSLPNPGLFAGETGKMLAPDLDESSFVAKDGTVEGLRGQGEKSFLVRILPGGVPASAPLPPTPRSQDGYRLRFDALLTTEPSGGGTHLLARRVSPSDASLPPAIDVGPIAPNLNAVRACRTAEATMIAVKSAAGERDLGKEHVVDSRISMAFRVGDQWLAPVQGGVSWASAPGDVSWGNSVLTCRGREGTLTWRAAEEVRQLRCTPQGCQAAGSGKLELPGNSLDVDASDLDGKVILTRVVKAATPLSGTTLSLRMRLAPIAEVARAPDVVLLGDEKHAGMALNGSVDVYVRRNAAAVLVRDDKVLRGIRVSADGKFDGLKLEGTR